jgi:foldase protein PrsA
MSFTDAVKKYSTDAASKKQKGAVGDVKKADLPAEIAAPVFAGKKNTIIGPVTSGGQSYVFEVTKITPASEQTLAQATTAIKTQLQSTKQQAAITAFSKDYEKRWRAKTQCAADFKVSVCANGPAPTPTPTPTATAPATDPAAAPTQ